MLRASNRFIHPDVSNCLLAVNTPAMSFSITGGAIQQGSMVGTQCTTDWITIPCATNTNDPQMQTGTPSVCVDRICGMVFNSATTTQGSPSVAVMSESESVSQSLHCPAVRSTRRNSRAMTIWQISLNHRVLVIVLTPSAANDFGLAAHQRAIMLSLYLTPFRFQRPRDDKNVPTQQTNQLFMRDGLC